MLGLHHEEIAGRETDADGREFIVLAQVIALHTERRQIRTVTGTEVVSGPS